MKITKGQLKRIIREEKARLSEANPDGTISDDEDEDFSNLLATVELQIDELVQYVKDEANRIGGPFRSPGYRRQAYLLMAEKIPTRR